MARRKGPGDPPRSDDDSSDDVDWGSDPEWDPRADRGDLDPDEADTDEADTDAPDAGDEDHLSGDTAYCPDCGAEVYDAADVCPKCFAWLDGETARHPPGGRRRSERFNRLVVWTLIATMLLGAGLFGLLAWISPGRE